MLDLKQVLMLKYKGIDFINDVNLQDDLDDKGVFIAGWNTAKLGVVPTASDLLAWQSDPILVQQAVYESNKVTNAPIYSALDAIDTKSIRALRSGDTARLSQLENEAVALRAQLLPTEE
jgi:hypothetical protein